MMTASVGITYSDPGTSTGLRRPEASGSPSSIRSTSTPVTFPSSTITLRCDPDTFRTDDSGEGRVSWFKNTLGFTQFLYNRDWPLGAALSLLLTLAVLAVAGLSSALTRNRGQL